jgi:hypothetical protein
MKLNIEIKNQRNKEKRVTERKKERKRLLIQLLFHKKKKL